MEGINPAALPGREHFFQDGRQLLFQGPALELNLGWHLISARIIP